MKCWHGSSNTQQPFPRPAHEACFVNAHAKPPLAQAGWGLCSRTTIRRTPCWQPRKQQPQHHGHHRGEQVLAEGQLCTWPETKLPTWRTCGVLGLNHPLRFDLTFCLCQLWSRQGPVGGQQSFFRVQPHVSKHQVRVRTESNSLRSLPRWCTGTIGTLQCQ